MSDDAGGRAIREAVEKAYPIGPMITVEALATKNAIIAGLCALRRVLRDDMRGKRDVHIPSIRFASHKAWCQSKLTHPSLQEQGAWNDGFDAGLAAVAKARGDG